MPDLSEELRMSVSPCHTRLEIAGDLDLSSCGDLRDLLRTMVEIGSGHIDIDMSLVTFCGTSALSALVAARNELRRTGRLLHISRASEPVLRLLHLSGLTALLIGPGADSATSADR